MKKSIQKGKNSELDVFTSKTPPNQWEKIGKKMSLRLFKKVVSEVPAYKKFIRLHHIKPLSVTSWDKFQKIPFINKGNYFHKYNFSEIFWQDYIKNIPMVVTSTSGSTSEPTYFLRTEELDRQYSILAEFFLKNGKSGSTLFINCFGMGVWIGGLMSYQAFRMMSLRGYPLSIITPGINKKEIFHCLKSLAPNFKNVILAGYPPFIKDIIDEAHIEGVDFRKFNTRLLFAAESFTESFRDYLAKQAHIRNIYFDTLNIYGSAELGAMAFETPTSIFIRRLALQNKTIYNTIFEENKLPTLAQFNPKFVYFEQQNNNILITANSTAPFLRYSIGDRGGTYLLTDLIKKFKNGGIDLITEFKKNKIPFTNLPFVYVYERADFSQSLYGLQVYPQHIKIAIEKKELQPFLTGKFAFNTYFDKQHDQYLQINLELKPNINTNTRLKKMTEDCIMNVLLENNSEFRELTNMLTRKRVKPRLIFWKYNHQLYFKSGIKQQWIKKHL